MKLNDLTGKRFGKLTVLNRVANQGKNRYWLCKCDCGTEKIIGGRHLTSGKTTSCGCYMRSIKPNLIHGGRHTKLYRIWSDIKYRCKNPNATGYKNYGGRGITICNEWANSFEVFRNFVSSLPHFGENGMSLDRINNNDGYMPGNVRWATASEQAYNRRNFPRLRDDFGRFTKKNKPKMIDLPFAMKEVSE